MTIFQGKDINSLYVEIIDRIMRDGEEIVKEGRIIKELFPCVIRLDNPKEGLLNVEGRPYSPAFLVAETLWNLAGDTDSWICDYNRIYNNYFTDGRLTAGYGNRIFNWDEHTDQFKLVADILTAEPYSQHADITIFNPSFDLKRPKFVPCITKLKFRIRNNKLYMSSYMRAQDMWLGFPYDINLLLTLFQLMAVRLKMEMGDYHHYCDVLRVYQADFEQAKRLSVPSQSCDNKIELEGIADFDKIRLYRDIIKQRPDNTLELIADVPEYWRNGIKAALAYHLLHQGKMKEARKIVDGISNCFQPQFERWTRHYHKSFIKP